MRRLATLGVLALALAGCPAAHDDYPNTKNLSCTTTDDCYKGETCDGTTHLCVAGGAPADLSAAVGDMMPGGDQ